MNCFMCKTDDSDMLPKLEIKRIESISKETQTDRQFRKTVSKRIVNMFFDLSMLVTDVCDGSW